MSQSLPTPEERSSSYKDQSTKQTPKKLRAACDSCHSAKVRCSGRNPCARCQKNNSPCLYSFRANLGKPKGSLNKKTKETLRRLAEGSETSSLLESRHIRRILSLNQAEKIRNDSSNNLVADRNIEAESSSASSTESQSPNHDTYHDHDQDPGMVQCERSSASSIEPPRTPLSSFLDMSHVDVVEVGIPDIAGTPYSTSLLDDLPTISNPCVTNDGGIDFAQTSNTNNTSNYDRLEAFNSFATRCTGFQIHDQVQRPYSAGIGSPQSFNVSPRLDFQTHQQRTTTQQPTSQYSTMPTPTSTTPFKSPLDLCSCLQTVANCVGQIRAIEQRECPLSLENNLHHYPIALSTVSCAIKCPSCSSDPQVLLLGSMVMKTISRWAQWLVSPPSDLGNRFRVQYSKEFVASEEDSCIVRAILTARVLVNSRNVVGLLKEKVLNVSSTEMLQMDYLQSQVCSAANSLESSIMKFNDPGMFTDFTRLC